MPKEFIKTYANAKTVTVPMGKMPKTDKATTNVKRPDNTHDDGKPNAL